MTDTYIDRVCFGSHDGHPVSLWCLSRQTALGSVAFSLTDFGATIQSLILPDAAGQPTDIVLGYDTLAEYVACDTYFGATVGRHANRIRRGALPLDGQIHQLDINETPHHLHGGGVGFDKRIWSSEPLPDNDGIVFRLVCDDGEMGYPGRLEASATYRLTESGGVDVTFAATTDRTTLCNLVQHSLWNLGGHAAGAVRDHVARVAADFYTPVGDDLIPTGEILAVDNTPFDFRVAKTIGRDFHQLSAAGYDHNLVLGQPDADGMRDCAEILCPDNGLGMRLRTDQPGVQVYAGTYLTARDVGKGGVRYQPNAGLALETQTFPDSPHHAHFPQAVLRPGQTYGHRMTYRFFHAAT